MDRDKIVIRIIMFCAIGGGDLRPDLIRNAMMTTDPKGLGASLSWMELFAILDIYGNEKSDKDLDYRLAKEHLMADNLGNINKGQYQSLSVALRLAIKECGKDGLVNIGEVLDGFVRYHNGYQLLKDTYDQYFI